MIWSLEHGTPVPIIRKRRTHTVITDSGWYQYLNERICKALRRTIDSFKCTVVVRVLPNWIEVGSFHI